MGVWPLVLLFVFCGNTSANAQHQTIPPLGLQDEGGTEAKPVFTLDCVGAGIECTQSGTTGTLTVGGGGSGNSFETIAVPAGASVVADSSTDTLTITEDTFLTLTGTDATDTIAITQVTTDLGTDGLIAANAVALTTDTTVNYVADVTAGTGLAKTSSASEGQTVDLSFDATEISSLTWGAGVFTTMTFDAGASDPTITSGSGTLTFSNVTVADGNVVDLDAINNSTTTEGLLLPQGTAPTGGTAEGQIGWETDVDELLIGTGSSQIRVGLFLVGGSDDTNRGANYTIQLFADDSGFTNTNAPPIATPIAMTCRNLVVNVFTAPGAGASWVATLQENETNTALTCTISDTNTQCTDTTNTEAIAANNRLQLSMVRNGTSANGGSGWVMACYPD